jgi:hypothetical protein
MLWDTPLIAVCCPWRHRRWRSASLPIELHCWTPTAEVEAEASAMTLFEILPSLRHATTPRIDRAIWPLTLTSMSWVGFVSVRWR